MGLMRREAFAIRGLPVSEVPAPAPPVLLPVTGAGAICWQGSVGATSYVVERAPKKSGPWRVAGDGIDESFTQYRPEFSDEAVGKGTWCYRVCARNGTGVSSPSNVSGPVAVSDVTFVDELADFSKVHSRSGQLGDQGSRLSGGARGRAPCGRPGWQHAGLPRGVNGLQRKGFCVLPEGDFRLEAELFDGRQSVSARGGKAEGFPSRRERLRLLATGDLRSDVRPGRRSLRENRVHR